MAPSKARQIRDQLKTIIEGIESGGESVFTEVRGHPRGEFDSYPSVRVLPGDTTSEKASTAEHDRQLNFIVRTHLQAKNDGTEFDHMYDLTEAIIDTLDKYDFDNDGMAGLDVWWLQVTRGDWLEEESQAGMILSCDLNVEVKYSVQHV